MFALLQKHYDGTSAVSFIDMLEIVQFSLNARFPMYMPAPERFAVYVAIYASSNAESPIEVNDIGMLLKLLIPGALIAIVDSGMLKPTSLSVVHPLNELASIEVIVDGSIALLNAMQFSNAPLGTTSIEEFRKSIDFRR